MPRPGPVERVRGRIRSNLGASVAARIPNGYERMGPVLLLRLPESTRPWFPEIARAFAQELPSVRSVLRRAGIVEGENREPRIERLWGDEVEARVQEHGTIYRLDPARILFSRGNKTERARAAKLVRPGERVADLFAGIGYFTIPAARAHPTVSVHAVERNPLALGYLERNLRENGVEDQVTIVPGDNRTVALPIRAFDRVFLGYLPSAVPWIPRALSLLAGAGTLHVHLVVDARERKTAGERSVREAIRAAGARAEEVTSREVKPYGPGRAHVVVDAVVRVP